MRSILLIGILLLSASAQSQQLVWDPLVMSTLVLQHTEQQQELKAIRSNEEKILTAQIFVSEKVQQLKEIHDKLYERLSQVQGIIADSHQLIQAGRIAEDIGQYQKEMLQLARENPALLLAAYQAERGLIERTAALLTYMYSVLVGGPVNLLDNRQRGEIIDHVIEELRLMRGMAFGVVRRMRLAARVGLAPVLHIWQMPAPDHDLVLVKEVLGDL